MDKRILNKQKLREKYSKRQSCNLYVSGIGVIGKDNGEIIATFKIDPVTKEKIWLYKNEKEIKIMEDKAKKERLNK